MKQFAAGMLATCLPLFASAADLPAADQPRFISLDSVRSGRPSITPGVNARSQPARLRSDAVAMKDGFFRLDRKTASPLAPQHALVVTPNSNSDMRRSSPLIISGTPTQAAPLPMVTSATQNTAITPTSSDPVLSLFNGQDAAPTSSFRDTLLGRAGAPRAMAPASTSIHHWPMSASIGKNVSSGFGYRADPITNRTEFHDGIDIAAPIGTPVLASASGQVAKVEQDSVFGKSITLTHADGSASQYGHLSAQNVTVGQQVAAGEPIGAVGATGRVTGAHLHYRLSQNDLKVDPMVALNLSAPTTTVADNRTPGQPFMNPLTRPRQLARSERLIVVR